ncbi:MAG: hypothetical protein ABSA02_42395 [Trebonia sp.]
MTGNGNPHQENEEYTERPPISVGQGADRGSSAAEPIDELRDDGIPVGALGITSFEAEDGQVVNSARIRHQVPVTDYLRLQARYAHQFRPRERTDVIERLQASADRNIERFGLLEDQKTDHPERTRLAQVRVRDSEPRW